MNGPDLLDQPGIDTYLARALLHRGDLDQAALQQLLAEVRAQRSVGRTLARTLLQRDLLAPATLEAALAELATHQTLAPSGAAPPTANERRIGDYTILDRLGAGGMGVVYQVEHAQTGARYALKTLHGVHDAEALLRFQREAEGQARVDAHPNVARIHSFGQYPAGLYLVMDLVEGGSLAQRLTQGALSPRESARIVRDLAHGLSHIHERGVLHRDLKPENVLLDGDVPKLTDFGLAKLVGEDSLTVSGTVLGTPAYMAPEQIDPGRGEMGPWTDVYGLGGVLYRCLTGRDPFEGKTALSIMMASLNEDPPAPRSLDPEIHPVLEEICLRALAKAPAKRYATAAALALDIDRFLGGASRQQRDLRPLGAAILLAAPIVALAGYALTSGQERIASLPAEPPPAAPAPPEPAPSPKAEEPLLEAPRLPLPRFDIPFEHLEQINERAKRLVMSNRPGAALELYESVLRDPLTGKVRQGPAKKLGELLVNSSSERPANLSRARALLFEATLKEEHHAARLLGQSHLPPEIAKSLEEKTKVTVLTTRLGKSATLSAACTAVYLSGRPGNRTSRILQSVLMDHGFPLPELAEAYRTLWEHYARDYPERAQRVLSNDPPPLPIPDGEWDEAAYIDFNHSDKKRRAETNAEAVAVFRRALFDPIWRLRARAARVLALRLCRGEGTQQNVDSGLDLLSEAALRGDPEATRTIGLAYLDAEAREELGQRLLLDGSQWRLGIEPNLRLVAACALLSQLEGDARGMGADVLHVLNKRGVEIPKTPAAAYRVLWEAYMARRRARK